MQQDIILIPPYHEQAQPTFLVIEPLLKPLLASLQDAGFEVWEPPHALKDEGPGRGALTEVRIKTGTPLEALERFLAEFSKTHCHHGAVS